MRKILILTTLLLALPFTAAMSQTPAFGLTGGSIIENNGKSKFLVQGDYRLNVKHFKDVNGVLKSQVYTRIGFVRANDIGLEPELSENLKGVTLIGMWEYHVSQAFFGIGYGKIYEFEDTATVAKSVYAGQLGWQPAKEIRLFVGCDYYDRGSRWNNLIAPYFGVALDFKDLIFE